MAAVPHHVLGGPLCRDAVALVVPVRVPFLARINIAGADEIVDACLTSPRIETFGRALDLDPRRQGSAGFGHRVADVVGDDCPAQWYPQSRTHPASSATEVPAGS